MSKKPILWPNSMDEESWSECCSASDPECEEVGICPCCKEHCEYIKPDEDDRMTVIDDGHYQGTQIFIIPNEAYQPSVEGYIMTHTSYGSCSGCNIISKLPNGYGCTNNYQSIKTIGIQDNEFYINGKYWGEVIEKNNNYIEVECNNGNRYMKGQIITVHLNQIKNESIVIKSND